MSAAAGESGGTLSSRLTPGNGKPVVSCRGVTKRYGNVRALDGVDLDIFSGEVHALLGENGAGKSTLIKILSGVTSPDSGSVALFGTPANIRNTATARGLGIGVAFQELSLAPDLSVSENLWLHSKGVTRRGTLSRRAMRERTEELFADTQARRIDPDQKVRDLSLAERCLVEVLRAVSSDPKVLILDEATASLPAQETEWLLGLTQRMAQAGKAVIFISHRMPEVRAVADRISILRDRVCALTARADALSADQIVETMLGRKPQMLYPAPVQPARASIALELNGFSVEDRVIDVDLQLHEGEIIGIGGLEGNGQSELLQGLFGVRPHRGEVRVNGTTVHIRNPRGALKAGLGLALIPEDRKREGLLLRRSIQENLTMAVIPSISRYGVVSRRKERAVASDAISRFSISASSPGIAVGLLSGGNQQKVVIAKLLEVGAKILLFHDLTRGVDVGTKADIFALARRLTNEGYSILMYSSANEELINMCDRVAVLRDGRAAAWLSGDELSEQSIMTAALGINKDDQVDSLLEMALEGGTE